jgi:hypothetical protein
LSSLLTQFSKLGEDKQQPEHNKEVQEATKMLETAVIPSFAAYLDRRYGEEGRS